MDWMNTIIKIQEAIKMREKELEEDLCYAEYSGDSDRVSELQAEMVGHYELVNRIYGIIIEDKKKYIEMLKKSA